MLTKMVNISTSQVGTRLFVFYLFCFFNQSNSQQNYKNFFLKMDLRRLKKLINGLRLRKK